MILPAEGDFRLGDEAATGRLGGAVARSLAKGEAVCLKGVLGAGKSTLARGLIRERTGTLGSFSEGLRMKLLPTAIATPNIHIGIIAGKLNGVMPATTPSGWRME